jgi:hypothetical protein
MTLPRNRPESLTNFFGATSEHRPSELSVVGAEKEDRMAGTASRVPRIFPPSAFPGRHVAIALRHNLRLGLCHREPCTTVADLVQLSPSLPSRRRRACSLSSRSMTTRMLVSKLW